MEKDVKTIENNLKKQIHVVEQSVNALSALAAQYYPLFERANLFLSGESRWWYNYTYANQVTPKLEYITPKMASYDWSVFTKPVAQREN